MQRKNSRERKINKKGEEYYQCEECKLIYEDKKWAEKCQKWCKRHKSCNLKITKYAVKLNTNRRKDGMLWK